ncbi:MAG TPA: hypothetical protein VN922_02855, partial [Bacteroidia bacterium]|nr:hypothetical protein [Bacteroidia bacterium]
TTPSPSTGYSPLYVITNTNGASAPSVALASGGPLFRGTDVQLTPVALSSGGPTTTTVLGVPTLTFQKSGTETVSLPLDLNRLNPYAPIKFKLTYSSDTAGGNFGIQAAYSFVGIGGSTSGGLTVTAVETMALGVAANALNKYETTVAVVPPAAFAGFNSGVWSLNTGYLALTFQRIPGAANDTNSGNLYLHKIFASQN